MHNIKTYPSRTCIWKIPLVGKLIRIEENIIFKRLLSRGSICWNIRVGHSDRHFSFARILNISLYFDTGLTHVYKTWRFYDFLKKITASHPWIQQKRKKMVEMETPTLYVHSIFFGSSYYIIDSKIYYPLYNNKHHEIVEWIIYYFKAWRLRIFLLNKK